MDSIFLNLSKQTLDGFSSSTPSKVDLLGNRVALFVDSTDDATSLIDNFTQRVEGIIITLDAHYSQNTIGPLLWHITVPQTFLPELQSLAQSFLVALTDSFKASNNNARLNLEVEQYQYLLENTRQSYNVTSAKLIQKIDDLKSEIEKRKQAEIDILTERDYSQELINGSPNIICGISPKGLTTFVNPAGESITGYSESELIGENWWNIMYPGDDYEQVEKLFKDFASGAVYDYQMQMTSKDGNKHTISWSSLSRCDEKGKIVEIIGFGNDVTKRISLEDELRQSKKMDAIGQLAGGIAHDFNNMLAGILGAAEILKMRINNDEKQVNFLNIILESTKRASELTSKLLTFSRKGKVESVAINVHQVINETVSLLRTSIDKKIEVQSHLNATKSTIIGDFSQLQNTFLNLGINASHAMPEGGRLLFTTNLVCLNSTFCQNHAFNLTPGNYLAIEIRDTGCGIPPGQLERIFEPFYTTKEQGKGTGLGLSAAYAAVQQHNGSITVESAVNFGTVFHILLPLSNQKESIMESKKPQTKGEGCILIVDDEIFIRSIAQTILEDLGYTILQAENGKKALDIYLANDQIDLIILDIVMPEMDGRECFETLIKLNPEIKIILSSGYSRNADVESMKKMGLKAFIRKPYLASELSNLVSEVLNATDATNF